MNLWKDDDNQTNTHRDASVCDVHFNIDCKRLPVDHAFALSEAVWTLAPWLTELNNAGVHPVHVAASQNGWERPDMASNSDLLLSRRTRLKIRIEIRHADRLIESLNGRTLLIKGNPMQIISGRRRIMTPVATLFSRYVSFNRSSLGKSLIKADLVQQAQDSTQPSSDDESAFVDAVVSWCAQLDYKPTKLLCGKSHSIATPQGPVFSRSVLLADVPSDYSLRLQETGIGHRRKMGCGLLIPHKDTGAVHQSTDE